MDSGLDPDSATSVQKDDFGSTTAVAVKRRWDADSVRATECSLPLKSPIRFYTISSHSNSSFFKDLKLTGHPSARQLSRGAQNSVETSVKVC